MMQGQKQAKAQVSPSSKTLLPSWVLKPPGCAGWQRHRGQLVFGRTAAEAQGKAVSPSLAAGNGVSVWQRMAAEAQGKAVSPSLAAGNGVSVW